MKKPAASVTFPTRWYEAWWIATTRPFTDAYRDLMERAANPLLIAGLWIFIVGLLNGLSRLWLFIYAYFDQPIPNIATYLIAIPLQGLITVVLWFTLMVGAIYVSARLLGGSGSLANTVYLKAAHVAPTLTLAILVSLLFWLLAVLFSVSVPSSVIYWFVVPLIIFQLILGYPTVRAAHDLDNMKSAIAGVIIPALILGGLYYLSTTEILTNLLNTQ